jgi:hypothetical protein
MRVRSTFLLMLLLAAATITVPVLAQPAGGDERALRTRIEARYDIVPLSDGVALRPKARRGDVRLIEIADGAIAINGAPVSGRELRERVGNDADAILRLSYLDDAARERFLAAGQAPARDDREAVEEEDHPADDAVMERVGEPEREVRVRRSRRARGDRVRVFGNVSVERDEEIAGQVVAVMGSVRVDGEVGDQVVAVLGSVDLGPNAIIRGDVVAVGGRVNRAPGAQVRGGVTEVALGRGVDMAMGPWAPGWGVPRFGPFGGFPRLVGTIFRLVLLLILVAIVFVLARGTVERAAQRVAEEPLKSTLVGIVVQILAVPVLVLTSILLAITIIGIPLLLLMPFVVLFLLVMALVGFTGTALAAGQWARGRFGFGSAADRTTVLNDTGVPEPRVQSFIERPGFLEVCAGVLVILLTLLIGRLLGLAGWPASPFAGLLIAAGVAIEYLAWTSGFGAVLTNAFGTWQTRRAARASVQPPPSGPPPAASSPVE